MRPTFGAGSKRVPIDWRCRSTAWELAELGHSVSTEWSVTPWHGNGATVRNLLDGSEQRVDADSLVLATTNLADTSLADELAARGVDGRRQHGGAVGGACDLRRPRARDAPVTAASAALSSRHYCAARPRPGAPRFTW